MNAGARTALFVVGLVLLLPGACSAFFLLAMPKLFSSPFDQGYGSFAFAIWLTGVAIGVCGIFFIVRSRRE